MNFIQKLSFGPGRDVIELTLDSRLKSWVLIPISIVMLLVGVVRQYTMVLLNSKVKTAPRAKITENQYLSKAATLLNNGINLHDESFRLRQEYLAQVLAEGKYLALKDKKKDDPQAILTDPNTTEAMMGMAMGNLANYIPQTMIMWWVNYFFAGFVLMKLPFPLTLRFKEMLQSGVLTADLDARWVSSISWYFISMFGLSPVFSLIFGGAEEGEVDVVFQQQFTGTGMPGGPTPDVLMKNYANDLTIARHESCFTDIEKRILKMYSK